MTESPISRRLIEHGIALPPPPKPLAIYVPAVRSGNLLFVAGQLPLVDGVLLTTGRLGDGVSIEEGQKAARQAALNALAIVAEALGDLESVSQIVRLTCHVASAPGFHEQHVVANGASELLGEIFAESGRHARLALGAAELPLGAPVVIELIVESKPADV
jgi:enamine deaminase RidA (YjgF/YER057c/UK114 family)